MSDLTRLPVILSALGDRSFQVNDANAVPLADAASQLHCRLLDGLLQSACGLHGALPAAPCQAALSAFRLSSHGVYVEIVEEMKKQDSERKQMPMSALWRKLQSREAYRSFTAN